VTTAVVIVVLVLLFAAASGRLGDGTPYEPPSREQLNRDTEDIAIYGAVVRPPLDAEEVDDDGRRRGGD
jgi:hypothetical protein